MSNPGSIFEKTYTDYLAQVNRLDIGARASRLGIETAGEKGVRAPMLLQFNDKDEEFPAECRLLFEERAEAYLDAECLAMLGRHLCKRLQHVRRV